MNHPQDVPAPSPTVSEAMREAVALIRKEVAACREEAIQSGLSGDCSRGNHFFAKADGFEEAADALDAALSGPIASALAALERENATLRAERDEADAKAKLRALALFLMEEKFEQAASDATGWHSEYKNERREKNSACSELATLRASTERMEAALEQVVALAPNVKPHPCDAPEDIVLWSIAELARAALTPKETPDA